MQAEVKRAFKLREFSSRLLTVFVAVALLFGAGCNGQEKQAQKLMDEALLQVRLAAQEPNNFPRVLYYHRQALANFDKLQSTYPNSNSAKALRGDLKIGTEPFADWRRKVDYESALIAQADKDLWAFTYAIGIVQGKPEILAELGQIYAKHEQVDNAQWAWNGVSALMTILPTNSTFESQVGKLLAEGYLAAKQFDNAAKQAGKLKDASAAGAIGQALFDAGQIESAKQVVREFAKQAEKLERSYQRARDMQEFLFTARFALDSPEPQMLMEKCAAVEKEPPLARLVVEQDGALGWYFFKRGDSARGEKMLRQAEKAAGKEIKANRAVDLYLKLFDLRLDLGLKKQAADMLAKAVTLTGKLSNRPTGELDKALVDIAIATARIIGGAKALALCEKIEDIDQKRAAYFLVSDKSGEKSPLEISLALAHEEKDPLKVADALADIAGYEAGQGNSETAKKYWDQSMEAYAQSIATLAPAHFMGGGEWGEYEIRMRRLASMLRTLNASEKLSPEDFLYCYKKAYPHALKVASLEGPARKALVFTFFSVLAPEGFEIGDKGREVIRGWLMEQRQYFVLLYKSVQI